MDNSVTFLFIVSLCMSIGLFLDGASIVLKGIVSQTSPREIVAYSGLIQYVSRIMFLLTTFAIVYVFESSQAQLLEIKDISTIVLLITMISSILPITMLLKLTGILAYPIKRLFFKNLYLDGIKGEAIGNTDTMFWIVAGMGIQVLMLTAIFAPILVAFVWPDFRMTLAYVGQLVNFSFTLIVLALVEPRLFREIDTLSRSQDVSSSIISKPSMMLVRGKFLGSIMWALVIVGYAYLD